MAQGKAKDSHFRQCIGFFLAVIAIVGMTVLVSGQAQAADHLLLQNTDSGKTSYWVMNSNGTLKNKTKGSGWGDLYGTADNLSTAMNHFWVLVGSHKDDGDPHLTRLIWQNTDNQRMAWWKLNTNGVLQDRTKGSGWGYLDEEWKSVPGATWLATAVVDSSKSNFGQDVVLFHNKDNGRTVYWRLNSNGLLVNRTQGSGWDNIDSTKYFQGILTADKGWVAGPYYPNADSQGHAQLVWYNTQNARVSWWKLNSNVTLKSTTEGDGFGSWWTLPSPHWRLTAISKNNNYRQINDSHSALLFMHNTDSGRAAYWVMNSNGMLTDRTEGSGWNVVEKTSEFPTFDPWSFFGIHEKADGTHDHLLWNNSGNGRIAYWKLNTNGTLSNKTEHDGWGVFWDLPTAWRLAGVDNYNNLYPE